MVFSQERSDNGRSDFGEEAVGKRRATFGVARTFDA